MDMTRLDSICKLQKDILKKAAKIVKINGIIVYSTCSLSFKQNEDVIESTILEINQNLDLKFDLILVEIFPKISEKSLLTAFGLKESLLKKTLRISPGPQSASAMYIAKLKKITRISKFKPEK